MAYHGIGYPLPNGNTKLYSVIKENTKKIFHKFKKEKLVSDGYNAFLQDQEHVDWLFDYEYK